MIHTTINEQVSLPKSRLYVNMQRRNEVIMNQSLDKNITTSVLLKFSFPTIISLIFIGLYTTIDGVFVSQLVGTDALSAINIILPLISVAIALGTMFGTGGSAVIAKKMGEEKTTQARENFSLLVVATFIVGITFSVVCFLFLSPLLKFLGADNTLLPYCWDYVIPTLLFFPFVIFSMLFQSFFIVAGKAHLGLCFSVLGGISNIVLDYILIKLVGLGIMGAAIATGIGYMIPSVIGFCYFIFNKKISLYLVRPKFDKQVIIRTFTNGSSELVTSLSIGVTTLLLNNILMKTLGSNGVASITIILYAYNLLSSAYIGYSIGIAPIISYNYGKQNTQRLKSIYKISLRAIFITSIITYMISIFTKSSLVSIFTPKGSDVYEIAINGYQLFATCFLFMGFNVFGSAMFTALSNGIVSAILSFLRTLLFVVIMALFLPQVIGENGIWLAIPMAELFGIIVTIFYFKKYKKVYEY